MFEPIFKAIALLRVRLANLVVRGLIRVVDDSKKLQIVQLSMLEDEVRDDVERVQNYGFTSVPKAGAEAIAVCVGGRREHALAIVVDDRRYRIRNLTSGEVAVYNHTGAKIVFKANGDIEVTPQSGQKLKVLGSVDVTGTLTATVDVVAAGKSLHNHTHPVTGTVSTAPGSVTFVPPGSTGAPS